jgi:hypothetical protein
MLELIRAARSTQPFGVSSVVMNKWPHLQLELTFLSPSEGGRDTPPPQIGRAPGKYRPHIVIGDPNQRRPIVVGNQGQETYLGVIFVSGPDEVRVGEPIEAAAELMYYPLREHDAVVPRTTFTLREGSRIVGYGRVKNVVFPDDAEQIVGRERRERVSHHD